MRKVHICLVSGQLLPNLIPILMDKPDDVILISSDEMEESTRRFKEILEQKGIKVCVHQSAPSSDLNKISQYAEKLKEQIRKDYPNTELILNITGGTKLMVLGIWDSFRNTAKQIIYTDTANNRIESLPVNDNKPQKIYRNLKSVLDVPVYLKCYGAEYKNSDSDSKKWQQAIQQRIDLTYAMGKNASKFSGLVKIINTLSSQARDDKSKKLHVPEQSFDHPPNGFQKQSLKCFQERGLLNWDGDKTISFKDYDSARYLGGFWLEEYVYDSISLLNPDDICSGVEISRGENSSIDNEMDTLVVHNNRLLVIECKTSRMDGQKDRDIIYKLDSLASTLKGVFGAALLVSVQKPSGFLQNRAKNLKIGIIGPEDLSCIKKYVQKWMETGKLPCAPQKLI